MQTQPGIDRRPSAPRQSDVYGGTTNLARPEFVPHYVACDVGGAYLPAQVLKQPTIVIGDGNDVAHRPAHAWQLSLQDDRLPVAD
jgi:hypothetical protein